MTRSDLGKWFFCLLLLNMGQTGLWAATEPVPDLLEFEIKLEDDPPKAHDWAREQLKTIDRQKNPVLYLRTLWLAIEVNHPDARPLFPLVPVAMAQAEALGLKEEKLRLQMHALRIQLALKKSGKNPEYFETMIKEARRLDVPRLLARFLFDYAFYLQAKGDLTRSLRHQDEAYQLLLQRPMSPFDQAILKNEMAILLIQQGQTDRALPMMLEVADYCKKAQVRAFAAVALYNLARQYDLKQTMTDAQRALPWYEASYHAAQAVGDEESRASNLYGLGSVALTLKEWQSSRAYLKEALALFIQQQDTRRTVETLILLARWARLQNKAQEALGYLQEAFLILPAEEGRLRHQLDEEMALVSIAAGHYAEATRYLQKTLNATRKLFVEQQKEEYQIRTVQLGLRVEEERNKVLLRENELQAQKLQQAQIYKIYVLILTILLIGMALFIAVAIVQTLRIRRSKVKMREILDHIEEGILTFDRHLKIEAEYSAYLQKFTHHATTMQGQSIVPTILDHSTLHAEEKSIMTEALQISLGEESLSWELNESQLPRELVFRQDEERIAALHWVPMFDSHGVLQRVLLTLRDVTEERRLSARIIQQEKREQSLPIKIRELLEAPIPSVVTLLKEISMRWSHENDRLHADPGEIRRHLHTFKGIARSLGLRTLSHAIHELEEMPTGADLWSMFFDHLAQYQQLIGQIFQTDQRSAMFLQKNLAAIVAELLPAFLQQMEQGNCRVECCTVEDAFLRWSDQLLADLKKVLVHVLSNAADHGYIRPHAQGKIVAAARLHIKAQRRGTNLEIIVTDNGAGLNQLRLTQAAKERNFQPAPGETVFDIVFQDGLSTAEQADMTSGRGVGLAAVAAICRSWQGEAHILPDPSTGGTRMTLQFKESA